MDFRNPIYWYFVLSLLYVNTALIIYYVARELKKSLSVDRKVVMLFLVVPILTFMPIPPLHYANSFMHFSLGKALAANPFSIGHCLHVSADGCNLMSFPAWSYEYHIILSLFTRIGSVGVQLMNSIFIGLFLAFTYLSIRKYSKTPIYLAAAVMPQMLLYLSTPIMEYAVLGLGAVFYYFLIEFFDRGKATPLIVSAMYFLHLRPESFVYVLLLSPFFMKSILKDRRLMAFTSVNLVVKYFEYQRSLFAPEYGLFLARRIPLLIERIIPAIAYFFNPFNFNLVFIILLGVGIIETLRSKKYLLLLPLAFAFFAYATHFQIIFYSTPFNSKIIDIAMAAFPIMILGLRKTNMPKYLLLLSIFPLMLALTSTANKASDLYAESMYHKNEIAVLSNNLSMPIFTYFPYEFEGIAEAVFIMDDFPYGNGSYIVIQHNSYPNIQKLPCNTTYLTGFESLDLLNMTCGG